MSNLFQQMRAASIPNTIRIPFAPDRTPRAQIEAAIASLPPRRCERHPHELQPVDKHATVRSTLSNDDGYQCHGWPVEFTATYERCPQCPRSQVDHDIEVDNCAVLGHPFLKFLTIRDEKGRPLPRHFGTTCLEADRSAREQFDAWLASQAGFRCQFSNQALRRCKVSIKPPFESWAIVPHFRSCLQCSLERLGISPDEAGASFDNFVVDPPEIASHLEICRNFAAALKGVLLLLGHCGTGKTHLAIAILRELLRRGESGLVFVKHRHFLAQHWQAQRPVAFREDPPESPLARCQESPLLVYDELTASTDSRAYEDVLLDLFEERIGHFKPSIITANISRDELEAALGTRLFDRLCRAAFAVLEFGFVSKRTSLNGDYLDRDRPGGRA